MAANVPCGKCAKEINTGDDFCPACGEPVSPEQRRLLQQRLEASDYAAGTMAKHVREAAKMVMVLAVLFAISGVMMFFLQQSEADKAMRQLDALSAEQMIPVEGKMYSVEELRRLVAREPYQVLFVNLGLGVIMFFLWMWARRSPLPAVMCALAAFVVVIVVSAILDPSSIAKGIIVKIIAFAALLKGVKSGLAVRELMARPPQPEPAPVMPQAAPPSP